MPSSRSKTSYMPSSRHAWLAGLAFLSHIISAEALPTSSSIHKHITSTSRALQTRSNKNYTLVLATDAHDFFDHFTTYTGADPTHGFIDYVDMSVAETRGYVSTIDNTALHRTTAYIGMDHDSIQASGRNSVRLSSKLNFTVNSLFIMDVAHVPASWGQWSSFWLLGQDGSWPSSGEIDIFESVHMNQANTITLHTSPGCAVTNSTISSGTLIETNCNAGNGNNGCSTKAPSSISPYNMTVNTAGTAFNAQNGAVFVTEWTESGIDVWMFDREAVPSSLAESSPSTAGFPTPVAHFAGSGCAFDKAFRDLQLIINIDACGDWAGNVWQSSGAAEATGVATCAEYVRNHPDEMKEAYFEFLSLVVYSKS